MRWCRILFVVAVLSLVFTFTDVLQVLAGAAGNGLFVEIGAVVGDLKIFERLLQN